MTGLVATKIGYVVVDGADADWAHTPCIMYLNSDCSRNGSTRVVRAQRARPRGHRRSTRTARCGSPTSAIRNLRPLDDRAVEGAGQPAPTTLYHFTYPDGRRT